MMVSNVGQSMQYLKPLESESAKNVYVAGTICSVQWELTVEDPPKADYQLNSFCKKKQIIINKQLN